MPEEYLVSKTSVIGARTRQPSLYNFKFTRTYREPAVPTITSPTQGRDERLAVNQYAGKPSSESLPQTIRRCRDLRLELRRCLRHNLSETERLLEAEKLKIDVLNSRRLKKCRRRLQAMGIFCPDAGEPDEPDEPYIEATIDVDTEPSLSAEQHQLLDLIAKGHNVFYTGSAGCGKSTVLKAAVKMLREKGKMVYVVAPTGRAALQVNGMTTWSYMGWTPDSIKVPIEQLAKSTYRQTTKDRISGTDVLIIDEISMIERFQFERIDTCIKATRNWDEWSKNKTGPAFGGVQLIVTGDFCQWPPVRPFDICITCGEHTRYDKDSERYNCRSGHGPYYDRDKWAFRSPSWEYAKFLHFHLEEIHRQYDTDFIRMLQKCRLGIQLSPGEVQSLANHTSNVEGATKAPCTLAQVQMANAKEFDKMTTRRW